MPVQFAPVERTPLKLSFVSSGECFIAPLSADDFRKVEDRYPTDEDTGLFINFRAFVSGLIAASVIDSDNRPVWTEAEVAALEQRRFREVMRKVLAHFGQDDEASKKNSAGESGSPVASA